MIYMLIAGEASGDLHAAGVMRALRERDPQARFIFFGGDRMAGQARHKPVVHYSDMAYMGFSEVLRNLGKIRTNLSLARRLVKKVRPDCLILVDYPGFNLKVAETAHDLGVKVYYYISPKVWAWKEWRVSTIRRVVDRLFVIFPFEVSYYKNRHQMDVTYVGNPSVSEIDEALAEAPDFHTFCSQHRLREKPVIALLPGSRLGEIRNNLPVMVKAAARFVQYQPVIGGAPSVPLSFYSTYTDAPVIHSGTIDLLRNARAALVTSGTATLEAALAGTPQVACYRANGMKISYDIMRKLLSVDYVTLPNLILGREAIPEKLVHLCTPDTVAESLSPLTSLTSPARQKMLADYAEMRLRLGEKDAAANVADCIIAELRGAAVTPAR